MQYSVVNYRIKKAEELPDGIAEKFIERAKSENLILEGDNLEALKTLTPFYYRKIKYTYIDPRHSASNKKWAHSDRQGIR